MSDLKQQKEITKEEFAANEIREFCKYVMHPDSDLHKDAEWWINERLQANGAENTTDLALNLHGVINWVATTETLPKNREQVLCWNGHRMIQNSWCVHTGQDDKWFKERFTHWAKLPEPPCL